MPKRRPQRRRSLREWRAPVRRVLAATSLVAVVAFQGVAAVEQSWTMDEPYHLLAGYQALAFGVDTINLEHPPLVKLVAAVPLLFEESLPWSQPVPVEGALAASDALFDDPELARRVRWRARLLLVVCFALPFLAVSFLLGRAFGGPGTGVLLAVALGLSPGVLPYLSLAQTDAAVALGFVTCLLGGVLLVRRPRLRWALVAGLGLGLGLSAKFSAVLLIPVVGAAVLLIPGRALAGRALIRRLGLLAAAGAVGLAIPYGVYAFAGRNDPGPPLREALESYTAGRGTLLTDDRLEPWRGPLAAVQAVSPEAARWAVGFLGIRAQDEIGVYPAYAFGAVDSGGRWWYFPAAFLVRTPLVLLAALGIAAWRGTRRLARSPSPAAHVAGVSREAWLPALACALYLGFALTSSYNIGFRHLLPVLAVLYLPAARWASRSDARAVLVSSVLLVEALALTPVWASATNTWWLGSANPTRHALGGSDGDYEQDLHTLARAADRRDLEPLYVVHPSLTPGELRAALPHGTLARPRSPVEPGWYAVSILVEQLVPAVLEADPQDVYHSATYRRLALSWGRVWTEILERGEELGYVAGTFHLYRVPPEPAGASSVSDRHAADRPAVRGGRLPVAPHEARTSPREAAGDAASRR